MPETTELPRSDTPEDRRTKNVLRALLNALERSECTVSDDSGRVIGKVKKKVGK